jgi:glycosyltransferase involved in cell wall biosynthesis
MIPRLAAQSPGDEFRLYVRTDRLAASIAEMPNLEVVKLPEAGLARRLRFTYLEMPRLAEAWGADLYYSAGEYAPLRASCPTIAAFRNPHVFAPLAEEPAKQRIRLLILRQLAAASARACDRILFVSADSARWIGDRMGVPDGRRSVVHHGIDLERWRPRRSESLHTRPYILSVSSIYRQKNYVRLIEAWAKLARRRSKVPDLVIIGDDQEPAYSRQMQEVRGGCGELAKRIHILGEVPYAEIRRWYAKAELFVFPSYLETFGHPLLEAMASDLPVVAADIPVFREIGGDAAFFADPRQPEALARAMEEALFVEGARQALVKRGRERVCQFTWDRSAQRLQQLFESVLAGDTLAATDSVASGLRPWPGLHWQQPAPSELMQSHTAAVPRYHTSL